MAANVLTISKVEAIVTRRYPIRVGGNNIDVSEAQIWPQSQNRPDDVLSTETMNPTALSIQPGNTANVLRVYFNFKYTQEPWTVAGSRYILEGIGPLGTRIRSAIAALPISATDADVDHFVLHVPANPTIPFADGGAWRWEIWYVPPIDDVPTVSVPSLVPTCLELYMYLGECDDLFLQHIDIELLRPFFPRFDAIYVAGAANPRAAAYKWIVETTWNHGSNNLPTLQYDAWDGLSHYLKGPGEDEFHLSKWLAKASSQCNCADLAWFTQVLCKMLGKQNNQLIIPSTLIEGDPFGHVVDGTLFGWPQHPNCNNPFFRGNNTLPHLDPANVNREAFSIHVWLEVPDPGNLQSPVVLEACHPSAAHGLEIGTQNQNKYHTRAVNSGPDYPRPPYPPSPNCWPPNYRYKTNVAVEITAYDVSGEVTVLH